MTVQRILAFASYFAFTVMLFAQDKTINGLVQDARGEAIESVMVVHAESGTVVFTEPDGSFVITLPGDAERFTVRRPGYAPQEISINTWEGRPISIRLEPFGTTLDEVTVRAVRALPSTPMTYSAISEEELAERNLGQDLPILLNFLPSVVTTSDAGAGVGYTGIRVRGSDATRVNVTVNGIPYNDSESQGVFWVNLPDFASSVGSAQLQRGVGTSTNGAGAFGASLNLLTAGAEEEGSAIISNSFGSFNTRRHQLEFNTGRIGQHFSLNGRLSRIASEGYVDRARSDLYGYYLQGAYATEKTVIKAITFGGREETYQAWYGIDSLTLANDRTFNFAGIYTDENGDTQFYDEEVDNYGQNHYQLHWHQNLGEGWSSNLAGHYTIGRGYFEQFREDEDMLVHGLLPLTFGEDTISTTDLIRRRWLDNDFYGVTASLHKEHDRYDWMSGGAWNQYRGDHFGEVIWARFASDSDIRDRYYDNVGEKDEWNAYSKLLYRFNDRFSGFVDLQLRGVDYRANSAETGDVDDSFLFFNPKAGLNYGLDGSDIYLSFARAHREPSRTDYENGNPVPEVLDNLELGWRGSQRNLTWSTNLYFMYYTDQLVLTGALDDVGNAIRQNVGESYRAGIELDFSYRLGERLLWRPNLAYSVNRNVDFFSSDNSEGELRALGDTEIAFSPELVIGNAIIYQPVNGLQLGLFTKYVSEQYMSNIEAESSLLEAYTVTDAKVGYSWFPKDGKLQRLSLELLVNNVLDQEYVSNGYWFSGFAGYYPQAGINYLAALTLEF